MSVLSAGNNFQ
ncbi:unnamed protein product [Staurois parvus]|uniref:Uncharacterized protein n=1 Tax=Staurois parvus TaxID=386267 RepID=A0ABN9FM60_9NEOB|nr:unnamed protein product [Staurois parvus]